MPKEVDVHLIVGGGGAGEQGGVQKPHEVNPEADEQKDSANNVHPVRYQRPVLASHRVETDLAAKQNVDGGYSNHQEQNEHGEIETG